MEAKQRTRKRRQPPSNPLTGIFTRQKSQIFLHNNRSGKSRPDPVRKTTSFPPKPVTNISSQRAKYQKLSYNQDDFDDEDEDIYHISIKDLRARRIFSEPLVQKEAESKQLGGINEVESGKNLNPDLDSELIDPKSDKCEDESCGFEKSSKEKTTDEGLLAERSNLGANFLRSTGCFDGENPNLSMSAKCDTKDDVGSERLNTESSNSSIQEENLTNRNCNSSMVEQCNNTAINFHGKGSNGENPNLWMIGKCNSMHDENPNSSVMESGDAGVEFRGEDSNGENPNSLVTSIGASDGTREISGCSNGGDTLDGMKEEKLDAGLVGIGKSSDYSSPNLSNRDLKGLNREICEGFTEENVQTTPPGAVIQIQQNDDGSALQNRNASSRSPTKKISPTKGRKIFSDSKRNMVISSLISNT